MAVNSINCSIQQVSQNKAANTSVVRVKWTVSWGYGTWDHSGASCSYSCDGQSYSQTGFSFNPNRVYSGSQSGSHDFTVKHNSDGSKTVQASVTIRENSRSHTASASLNLAKIYQGEDTPDYYWVDPTKWKGATLVKDIPADKNGDTSFKNWRLDFHHFFASTDPKQAGRFVMQVEGTDGSGNACKIASFAVHKAQIGNQRQNYDIVYYGGKKVTTWYDGTEGNAVTGTAGGYQTITKIGSEIRFNISGTNFSQIVSGAENCKATRIVCYFGINGENPRIARNVLYSCNFTELDVTSFEDVPNSFKAGDVIRVDCNAGKILVNGINRPDLGNVQNDFEAFELGDRQYYTYSYSGWASEPAITVEYRGKNL